MKQEIDNMFQGYWQTTIGYELKGKLLGLLGLGKIGTQVASVAKAFGMDVCAWSENLNLSHANKLGVLPMSKEDLIKNSDIISIHLVFGDRYKDLITKNGGVSEIVAFYMAKNSLKILNADLSIAVTGIAGPTGGSVDKPVGLVWIGIGTKEKIITNKYQFNGDRLQIRQKTTYESLKLANDVILEI